jgi:hypothetical protein
MYGFPYNLPEMYDGKKIKMRLPYTMPGELVLDNGAVGIDFPDGTFLHSVDKPFEVWGMKLSASQLVASIPVAAPAPDINKFWRVRVVDVSKNYLMTKAAALVATLIDSDTGDWYWRCPYTIVRAEGFQVTVDNLLSANPGNQLRAEVEFRGFQLIIDPPSNTR